MLVRDPEAVLAKLAERNLKIDSYFLRSTGFIANQTILKLGEYNLNCLPASIGPTEAQFLAALSATEVNLFAKYKEGTHLLMLTFDNPDSSDVARFPLRVGLLNLAPVPDRKGICLLTLKLKSMPAEFVNFLGDYLDEVEDRLQTWEALASEMHELSANLLALGLVASAVLAVDGTTIATEIQAFTTKRILLAPFESVPAVGSVCQLRMAHHGKPLVLAGVWAGEEFAPEFNADWFEVVRQVKHRKDFQNRERGRS